MATKKKTFREIQEKMSEITKRPPSKEQLEDLKNMFIEIDRLENETTQKPRSEGKPSKKIARTPEIDL